MILSSDKSEQGLALIRPFLVVIIFTVFATLAFFGFREISYRNRLNVLRTSIQTGDVIGVLNLIKKYPALLKADLGTRKDNLKPLAFAAGWGSEKICDELITLGADINEQDKFLFTPLHRAVGYEKPNVVALLLARGANPTLRDNTGRTPLDIAIGMKLDFTNLLSEAIARFNTKQ